MSFNLEYFVESLLSMLVGTMIGYLGWRIIALRTDNVRE